MMLVIVSYCEAADTVVVPSFWVDAVFGAAAAWLAVAVAGFRVIIYDSDLFIALIILLSASSLKLHADDYFLRGTSGLISAFVAVLGISFYEVLSRSIELTVASCYFCV